MDILKELNASIAYIESNLDHEIDMEKASRIACATTDGFGRFFSYIAGMTVKEYIRCRRLTLAAFDLRNGYSKVIDVAVKYGWDSADAFTKAFIRQHGIPPSKSRNPDVPLTIYPPVSFHIMIKGARKMNFRIVEVAETEVYGMSKRFDGQGHKAKEELRHIMWSEDCEFVPGKICEGYDGVWYGIWRDGKYLLAREKGDVPSCDGLEKHILPAGTYSAFKTEPGGLAWEEFPKLFESVFDSWLPGSEYRQAGDVAVEVYHLWTDGETRRKNRYYELWIPVMKK